LIGMALVAAYFSYTYRHFAGKIDPDDDGGYH
jgi:cytochrome bd-type quinol oxidase subunit 2